MVNEKCTAQKIGEQLLKWTLPTKVMPTEWWFQKCCELIEVGFNSNFGHKKNAKYIFLTATLDAAIWGAELAFGEGRERIYLVEPTGQIEDDPDLTDKKFPGNPTKSYRSTQPFKVVGEVTIWQGHPTEQVKTMKEHLERLKEQGINSLND